MFGYVLGASVWEETLTSLENSPPPLNRDSLRKAMAKCPLYFWNPEDVNSWFVQMIGGGGSVQPEGSSSLIVASHILLTDAMIPSYVTCVCPQEMTKCLPPTGLSVTDDILQGKTDWSKLFQPPNFFLKYKYVFIYFNVYFPVYLFFNAF